MAGAMRRMGIYLGLVEDDDTRGTAGTTPGSPTTSTTTAGTAGTPTTTTTTSTTTDYAGGYADDDLEADEVPAVREPEPLVAPGRVAAAARPLGLAPAGAGGAAAGSAVARRLAAAMGSGPVGATAASSPSREPVAAPVPEPAPAARAAPQPYRITTLHPRTYNEARTIGERFRDGMPVIMNLTEMDDADAKRLVDFAAGLSFGLRGSIERVTAKVFLLSPQNVDVTAEDKARIREGGFFNQS